jgi:hypothetical protein
MAERRSILSERVDDILCSAHIVYYRHAAFFKPIFMVQPTKDSMGHHPEVWGNLMPVRLQRNG